MTMGQVFSDVFSYSVTESDLQLKEIIQRAKEEASEEDYHKFFDRLYSDFSHRELNEEENSSLLRKVLIDFLVTFGFHRWFFDDSTQLKVEGLIQRNDYKARPLTELVSRFSKMLYLMEFGTIGEVYSSIMNQLKFPYKKAIQGKHDEFIKGNIKKIKEDLVKIFPSISNSLIYKLGKMDIENDQVEDNINTFRLSSLLGLVNSYQYEMERVGLTDFQVINTIISNQLPSFKEFSGLFTSLLVLLEFNFSEETVNLNRLRQYVKTLLEQNPKYTMIMDKKLPLAFMFESNFIIIQQGAKTLLNERFGNLLSDEMALMMMVPWVSPKEPIDTFLQKGREVFCQFLIELMGDQANSIIEKLQGIEEEKEIGLEILKDIEINYGLFSWGFYQHFLSVFVPQFYQPRSTIERLYATVAVIKNLYPTNYMPILVQLMNRWLYAMELLFNVSIDRTRYVENKKEKIARWVDKMNSLGVSVKQPELYLTALMDREVASHQERDMFPYLEQLGDAIYEWVVVHQLIKDLNITNNKELTEKKTYYCQASSQEKIANLLELKSFYVSYRGQIVLEKMAYHERFGINYEKKEMSYLADSFEMVLGVLYLEHGLKDTVTFLLSLLNNVFSERVWSLEDLPTYGTLENLTSDEGYMLTERMHPSITLLKSSYETLYHIVGTSLFKILLILVHGNETIEKRNWLQSKNPYSVKITNIDSVGWLSYWYLNYGWEVCFNKFKDELYPLIIK